MKKVLALALCVCMAAMLLAGCGGAGSSSAAASASGSAAAGTSASAAGALDPNIKATLTFATYDNEAMDLYEEMDLEGRFQELYPNVNIEIEECVMLIVRLQSARRHGGRLAAAAQLKGGKS